MIIPADLKRKSHRAALERLIDEYRAGPAGEGRSLAPGVRRRIAGDLARHPSSRVFLAAVGRAFAGAAVCFRGYSTFRGRPLLNVHDLAVAKRFRRRGVATALLAGVEAAARKEGACRLTLEVRADNRPARVLYRKSGFRPGLAPMLFLKKEIVP